MLLPRRDCPGGIGCPQARRRAVHAAPGVGELVKPGARNLEVQVRTRRVPPPSGLYDLLPRRHMIPRPHEKLVTHKPIQNPKPQSNERANCPIKLLPSPSPSSAQLTLTLSTTRLRSSGGEYRSLSKATLLCWLPPGAS